MNSQVPFSFKVGRDIQAEVACEDFVLVISQEGLHFFRCPDIEQTLAAF